MQETVQTGFDKVMGGDSSSLQSQIDDFIGVFREVLFSIWLGDDPAEESLKKAMLGK